MKTGARLSLASLALLVCLSAGSALAAPLVELTPEARRDTGSFKELKQIEKILSDVAKLRALPVKRAIQIGILDRSQLSKTLAKQIQEEIPADKIKGESALYQQLGMLPPEFDYKSFLIDLYTEQIGGFYDPKTRELNLIKGTPLTGMDQQMLIAHELTHALQDQHYDLKKYMSSDTDNDDLSLARTALIEGDATVAATEYIQSRAAAKPLQGLFEMLGSAFNAARQMQSFEKFRNAPAFIQNSLIFPYDQGAQFVNAFRLEGWSWTDLNQIYSNPPTATEHILHPDSYLTGDAPQKLQIGLQPLIKGSKVLTGSVWGELGYRQYFAHHLDWREAKNAAQGWRGDRYEVLETPQGLVFSFFSSWDDESEAQAFFSAWRTTLAKRNAGISLPATGGTVASGNDKLIWAQQQGNTVAIVENLPSAQKALLPQLLKAWQQESAKPRVTGKPVVKGR